MTNVVIGAASGMGAAVARRLAPRGPLVIADRSVEGLEDQEQVDALFAEVDELDALVVTAGISSSGMTTGRPIFEVNLVGMARVLRAAEPLLRPGTVAVGVASQSGYMVPDDPDLFAVLEDPLATDFYDRLGTFFDYEDPSLAYQTSKRGVHRLVRSKAAAWGARGARIVSVSPGINDTPMNRALEADQPIMQQIIASSPLGRRGTPDEIAAVVAFVTSDEASLLTGSDVLADGGMVSVLPESWAGKLKAR
jgi:NAD(P)-dependent dehydrogenase (short-subunit alcohol dehydrogenase family)